MASREIGLFETIVIFSILLITPTILALGWNVHLIESYLRK